MVNWFSTMGTQQDSSKNRPLGTLPLASMYFHPVQGTFAEATPPPNSAFMSSAAEHIFSCSCSLLYLTWFQTEQKQKLGFIWNSVIKCYKKGECSVYILKLSSSWMACVCVHLCMYMESLCTQDHVPASSVYTVPVY